MRAYVMYIFPVEETLKIFVFFQDFFFSPLGLVISDLISANEKKNELIYSPTTCDMQFQTKFISFKNNEMKMD